jgi:hypothetical protein
MKILSKLSIEENFLNLIKGLSEKPTAYPMPVVID